MPDGCTPGCGACCRWIVLQVNPQYDNPDIARWIGLHGIRLQRRDGGIFAYIPTPCSALGGDGMCTIYEERPEVCRIFPTSEAEVAMVDEYVGEKVCTVKFEEGVTSG